MAKNTQEKQVKRELNSMEEMYSLLALRIGWFLEHAVEAGPVPVWDQVRFY